jgi:phytoene dehydrogenase-like protein
LIGMMDISARKNVRASLGPHALSFTAPWPLFQEMEQNVKGSFLERETWRSLRENA